MNCSKTQTVHGLRLMNINPLRRPTEQTRRLGSVLIWAMIGFLAFSQPVPAEILDSVVATINEEIIAESELREAMEIYQHQITSLQKQPGADWQSKALERRVLEDLIDKKLIEDYAQKMGITASEGEIDNAIQDVLDRAHISISELMQALEKDGIRYEEYRDQIRNQIIKAKMVQREIRTNINVKEEDIQGYYLDHPERFRTERGTVLRHILLPLSEDPQPEVVEATEKEALRIRQEILAGLPFEDAAGQYSQDSTAARGGWLGFFREGSLSPSMGDAVKELNEGEVSEPVRTPLGIHLIKLVERTSGEIRPLERVRENIREALYEEAAERQFEQWRKDLRKNAHIEVFL